MVLSIETIVNDAELSLQINSHPGPDHYRAVTISVVLTDSSIGKSFTLASIHSNSAAMKTQVESAFIRPLVTTAVESTEHVDGTSLDGLVYDDNSVVYDWRDVLTWDYLDSRFRIVWSDTLTPVAVHSSPCKARAMIRQFLSVKFRR